MSGSARCHQCGHVISAGQRIGRRDACLHCGADLRCCLNCAFHEPGAHNDCREPQAERQLDRARGNFCDWFSLADARPAQSPEAGDARAALARLFAERKSS